MRTLAIDCATEACSAALFEGDSLLGGYCEVIGRGHAERLVPMIAQLPGNGKADRIIVSLGPGSFTGVRIGIAAARALGLAWNAPVLGYPTLTLVAARAQAERAGPVTICMAGGHGEWFVQNFEAGARAADDVRSLAPADAALASCHPIFAGSKAAELGLLVDGDPFVLDLLPDARAATLLPVDCLAADLGPIYGRAPDARLPGVGQ